MRKRKFLLPTAVVLFAAALLLVILHPWDRGPSGPVVVCLDAGHGGTAAGAEFEGRLEKDDNLKMALRVRDLLESSGCELKVVLTRTDDSSVELQERCDIATEKDATMFVSLHRTSGGGAGVETWTVAKPTDGDTALAKAIQTRLVGVGVSSDRDVRNGTAENPNGNYYVLEHTEGIPGCLVELGFIDSAEDNALLDEHFEEYAAAIADGILYAAGLK